MKNIFALQIFDTNNILIRTIELTAYDAFLMKDAFSHVQFDTSSITLYFSLQTNYAL